MARVAVANKLLALRQSDPRAARIPLAAFTVWQMLADLMDRRGDPAVLPVKPGSAGLAEIAAELCIGTAELGTQIEVLVAFDALDRGEGTLRLPHWALPAIAGAHG